MVKSMSTFEDVRKLYERRLHKIAQTQTANINRVLFDNYLTLLFNNRAKPTVFGLFLVFILFCALGLTMELKLDTSPFEQQTLFGWMNLIIQRPGLFLLFVILSAGILLLGVFGLKQRLVEKIIYDALSAKFKIGSFSPLREYPLIDKYSCKNWYLDFSRYIDDLSEVEKEEWKEFKEKCKNYLQKIENLETAEVEKTIEILRRPLLDMMHCYLGNTLKAAIKMIGHVAYKESSVLSDFHNQSLEAAENLLKFDVEQLTTLKDKKVAEAESSFNSSSLDLFLYSLFSVIPAATLVAWFVYLTTDYKNKHFFFGDTVFVREVISDAKVKDNTANADSNSYRYVNYSRDAYVKAQIKTDEQKSSIPDEPIHKVTLNFFLNNKSLKGRLEFVSVNALIPLFEIGDESLTKDGEQAVREVFRKQLDKIEKLCPNANPTIKVFGLADSTGFKYVDDDKKNKEMNIKLANDRSIAVSNFLNEFGESKNPITRSVDWYNYSCELQGNIHCDRDVTMTYERLKAAMVADRDSEGNILDVPARFNRRIDLSIEYPSECDSSGEVAYR